MDAKAVIAARVGQEFRNGDYVNLGIGVPTLVTKYLPSGVTVMLHADNGYLGMGPAPAVGEEDPDIITPGFQPASMLPGAVTFDSAMSFAIIRGGHVSTTVLGALEVDEEGNMASWIVPGRQVSGMGGAMDLVTGARKVIVAMEHTVKGQPRILKKCALPLTAVREVDMIVTELAVFNYLPKLTLMEIAPTLGLEELKSLTPANYLISAELKEMRLRA